MLLRLKIKHAPNSPLDNRKQVFKMTTIYKKLLVKDFPIPEVKKESVEQLYWKEFNVSLKIFFIYHLSYLILFYFYRIIFFY